MKTAVSHQDILRKRAIRGALRVLAILAGTIEKPEDNLLNVRPPEPKRDSKAIVVDPDNNTGQKI